MSLLSGGPLSPGGLLPITEIVSPVLNAGTWDRRWRSADAVVSGSTVQSVPSIGTVTANSLVQKGTNTLPTLGSTGVVQTITHNGQVALTAAYTGNTQMLRTMFFRRGSSATTFVHTYWDSYTSEQFLALRQQGGVVSARAGTSTKTVISTLDPALFYAITVYYNGATSRAWVNGGAAIAMDLTATPTTHKGITIGGTPSSLTGNDINTHTVDINWVEIAEREGALDLPNLNAYGNYLKATYPAIATWTEATL